MKSGLESVSGWCSASYWTATTPGMAAIDFAAEAGNVAATPP